MTMYIRHSDMEDVRYIQKSLNYVFGFQIKNNNQRNRKSSFSKNKISKQSSPLLKNRTTTKHRTPTSSPLRLQVSPILTHQQSRRSRLLTVPELRPPSLLKKMSSIQLQPSNKYAKLSKCDNYNKLQLRLQNLINRVGQLRQVPLLNSSSKKYFGVIGKSKRAMREYNHQQ